MYKLNNLTHNIDGTKYHSYFEVEVIYLKFAEGFLTGMVLSLAGCVVFKFMFPEAEEEMCHSVKRISKDMGKELQNMK